MTGPRCRRCGEYVDGEIGQIDAALSAASTTTGELRAIYVASARAQIDRLTEALRVRRLALEHAEGDMVRSAGEAKR